MILVVVHGAVAQLVAHLHGMQGVRGSSPLSSTRGRARSSDRALSLCGVRSVCSALGVECTMSSALRRDDASSPCHVSPLVLTRAPSPRSRIRGPPEDRAACSLPLAVRCLPPAVCRRLFAVRCSPPALLASAPMVPTLVGRCPGSRGRRCAACSVAHGGSTG